MKHMESGPGRSVPAMRNNFTRSLLITVFVTSVFGVGTASAQVAVSPQLNSAAPYGVLGTNAAPTVGTVTCTNTGPGSTLTARVGTTFTSITNTACTITGPIDAPVAGSVVTDFNNAFSAITTQNQVCTGSIPTTSTTLAPGVYCSAAGTTLGSGVILTLLGNASDVWVFRVGTGGPGALTLNSAQVVMGGTALACNVFWKTSAAATLTDSIFNGTLLSGAAATMTRGSWVGRVMATTDVAITDAAPFTFAGCSAPVAPSVAKAFSPSTNGPGGVSTLTITLTNSNAGAATLTSAFVDTLPSGVVLAASPSGSTTCSSGVVTATAGGSSVTLSSGSVIPSNGSCTVIANVTAAAAGSYVNTIPAGALTTSNGNNPSPASATLTISASAPPVPTLPEWAMILLAALLGLGGVVALRRRRMTA